MSVLALDVGERRIGVAVSDPARHYALPVGVIDRTNLQADLKEIAAYLQSYDAQELVVGDPVTLRGERGFAAEKIDRFVGRLAEIFHGPIHRVDERLTTAAATKTLIAADVSRSKRKRVVDKLAAALILEAFLARRRLGSDA
ncbi:MAG: Holliday junction resolvase RuvX [Vulcanimicrobiaceae bacterium]